MHYLCLKICVELLKHLFGNYLGKEEKNPQYLGLVSLIFFLLFQGKKNNHHVKKKNLCVKPWVSEYECFTVILLEVLKTKS